MGKYPIFRRWIVRLPPEERRPYLHHFSARLDRRLEEINSYLNGEIDEVADFSAQPEIIQVPDTPPPPVQNGQPGDPIVISDDEEPMADIEDLLKTSSDDTEPLADIEDLLKTSEEEDTVEEDVVTAPPFSFSELETEGDSVLEDLEISAAEVPMDVVESVPEEASVNPTEDIPEDAENNSTEDVLQDIEVTSTEDTPQDVEANSTEDVREDVEVISTEDPHVDEEDAGVIGVDEEVSTIAEALGEDLSVVVAAQDIPEDANALVGGPELMEDFSIPLVDLESEDSAPLATSATKSASTDAPISSSASPEDQENSGLQVWTAIFHPASKRSIVSLRFRSHAGYHLRHTPVEERSKEYTSWKWPTYAQIPTGKFSF